MKLLKFLTFTFLFSTNIVLCQSTSKYIETFINDVYTEGNTKVMLIDSIKIQQSDTIYRTLESPIKLFFLKDSFVLEDFSFSTHSIEKGKKNDFQRGSTGVYGETEPYYLNSTIYLDGDIINDRFELSLAFDDLSIKNNQYRLKFTNTGFDFNFKGSFIE